MADLGCGRLRLDQKRMFSETRLFMHLVREALGETLKLQSPLSGWVDARGTRSFGQDYVGDKMRFCGRLRLTTAEALEDTRANGLAESFLPVSLGLRLA